MNNSAIPDYARRATFLLVAVGIVGLVIALLTGSAGNFLTFNLSHIIVMAILLLIGGLIIFFGGQNASTAPTIANVTIGLGVAAAIIAAVVALGNLAPNILGFDTLQILILGILFIIVGFLIRMWLNSQDVGSEWPRRIAWTIIGIGVLAIILGAGIQLLNLGDNFLTFSLLQLFALGVLFLVVGILLLIMLQGEMEPRRPMVQARAMPTSTVPPRPASPVTPPAPMPAVRAAAASAAPAKKDDLIIIEGIGPKSQEALFKAGITTFQQVADMSPKDLERIVKTEGGVNLVNDPSTWPQQAKLLAEGRRQEFDELVKRLVNSRDKGKK
jgi:predicted flap endonuclease-1-like 5' DNA nuclease